MLRVSTLALDILPSDRLTYVFSTSVFHRPTSCHCVQEKEPHPSSLPVHLLCTCWPAKRCFVEEQYSGQSISSSCFSPVNMLAKYTKNYNNYAELHIPTRASVYGSWFELEAEKFYIFLRTSNRHGHCWVCRLWIFFFWSTKTLFL